MDILDSVRTLGVEDPSAGIVDARNSLHRAMAGEQRRRRRRGLGIAFGTAGGVVGASAVAALVAGTFTVGAVVAAPAPASASAAEKIVLSAAAQVKAIEIPAGKYLKTTETHDSVLGFHGPTEGKPFSYVLQDATGVVTTRSIMSTFISSDAGVLPIHETGAYLPVEAEGDVQGIEDAWNSHYGHRGLWDDVIASPPPPAVFEGAIGHAGLAGDFDEAVAVEGPDDSRTDDWGAFATDPQAFLDDALAEFPTGTTKQEAIEAVFETLVFGSVATASAEYRAVLLGVIALGDGLEVESVVGTVSTVRLDTDNATLRLVVDTETNQLLEVSQRMAKTWVDNKPVGTSPLVDDDAPTTIKRITQEIVDAPPAINTEG